MNVVAVVVIVTSKMIILRTEEMRPQWYSYDDIPYDSMWADDRLWLPLMLSGQPFVGEFHFPKVQ